MSVTSSPVESAEARSGWVAFVATQLALAGVLELIWGIAAVSNANYFGTDHPLWAGLETWGWIAIVLGVVKLTGTALVVARRTGGAVIALLLAVIGLSLHFFTIAAFPLWSLVMLAINGLVMWAVVVHGEAFVR